MAKIASFSTQGLSFFFQSNRARVDGKATSRLTNFIRGAKHSLDVAIYDLRNKDVLTALKDMSAKVQLHILYDAGKAGGQSTTVDPKSPATAQAIGAAGLKAFAQPVAEKSGHLMHDKFIVRDGSSVWSGSGNFTHGGLSLQDNNFFIIESAVAAASYSKVFGDLGSPGHSASHSAGVNSSPTKLKIGSVSLTIYFSTLIKETEGIEVEVQDRLKRAKKVRIMAMLVSDPGILTSLMALKNRDIKGVLDPHEMKVVMRNKAGAPEFWFANGDPRFVAANSHAFNGSGDKNDFMHNKVMIIDDEIVITGSYNFSENAEANDENLLVFESTQIAAAYNKYFDSLFTQYQKTGLPLPP
ncbi:MAG TPA: phospholipase D-like domain-containing protein [Verrucomicrobiae bacterium]|nr:phospholipase D-like domain-containing protein [Verrucomicrobiae bacterium]